MNAQEAIRDRNAEALVGVFSSLEEASEFKDEVLPYMQPDDCLWFWRQVMTPEQLNATFESMRDVVLSIAAARGLVPEQVQGGYQGSIPILYAASAARDMIFTEIPKERHSFLNALLIPFPENNDENS